MAVKIRMQRFGRKNRPYYRLVAADSRSPRDGRALEILGTYDPIKTNPEEVTSLKPERIKHWLSVGAQPSETAASLIKKAGILIPWVENAKRKKAAAVAARRAIKGPKVSVARKSTSKAKKVKAKDVDTKSKKAKRDAKKAK